MINLETMHLRSDENLLILYEIFNRRSKDETLKPEIIAIFITNLEIVLKEIEKRGLKIIY